MNDVPARHPGGRTCAGALPLLPYYIVKVFLLMLIGHALMGKKRIRGTDGNKGWSHSVNPKVPRSPMGGTTNDGCAIIAIVAGGLTFAGLLYGAMSLAHALVG